MGRSKHVRRLDVGPEERSTYRHNALGREFGYRAKKIRHCIKKIGCCEKTICRLGNTLKERTMYRRIGLSTGRTNDMSDNIGYACNQLCLD